MAATDSHGSTMIGTTSGTLLALLACVDSADVIKAMILATTGAVVSFSVSLLLKWIATKIRNR